MEDVKAPYIAEEETDLIEIAVQVLRVIQGRFLWILLVGLVTLAVTVVALAFVPNVYSSEATILVVEQQIPQHLVAPLSTVMGTQKLQAMTQEVLSRSRLLRIIEETKLYSDKQLTPDAAIERMRKSIGITPEAVDRDLSFGAFVISFSASTPEVAQDVTRRLASLFIERYSETQTQRANSTQGFLGEQLSEKRKALQDIEQRIREFKVQNAGALPESRAGNQSRLAEHRTQLQNSISNLNRAKQQRVVWESMLNGSLNTRLTRMKAERAALAPRLTPKHPEMIKRDEEIAAAEKIIANVQAGVRVSDEQLGRLGSADAALSQLQGQLDANRLEIENLTNEQKRLEGVVSSLQYQANLSPLLEQQLTSLVRQSEALNQEILGLEKMEQQSELSADMERRKQGEQFRQLEAPTLPLRPVSPKRLRISAGAAVAGMALGLALAFFADTRRRCFQNEGQIKRKFSPPLVLSIPALPTPKETRARRFGIGLQIVSGFLVVAAMAAIEFYVYKNR